MSFQLKKLNLELNTINDEVSEYRKDSGEREKASGEWMWVGGGEAYAKSKTASNFLEFVLSQNINWIWGKKNKDNSGMQDFQK